MGFLHSATSSQRYIWVITYTSSTNSHVASHILEVMSTRCVLLAKPLRCDPSADSWSWSRCDHPAWCAAIPPCWWGCAGERGGLTLPVHPRAHYADFYTKQSRPTHTVPSRTSSCEMFWMGWKLRTCLPMLLEVLHPNCRLTEHRRVPLPDPQRPGTSRCQPLLGKAEKYFLSNLIAFCTGVNESTRTYSLHLQCCLVICEIGKCGQLSWLWGLKD